MTEPLLFLPGMMCDRRLFGPQEAALIAGRAVLHGDITGAADMAALAGQVLEAAPERFALAGLSMGGIVAMEVIRQAPDRVTRLALMDTNPRAELPEVKARRAPQMAEVRAGGLERVMREELKPNYLTDGPRHAEILDLCMDMALGLGAEVFVRQSIALRDRPDQQDTLRAVRVPTLVLCGRHDALCPVERHRLMQGLVDGSTLVIVDDAGHIPTLERPGEVTAALRDWLARPAVA